MCYLVMMRVLDGRNDLLEDLLCVRLGQLIDVKQIQDTYLLATSDKIEQFTARGVLQNHKNLRLRVDELEQFDRVRVIETPQNFQLSLNLFEDSILSDFLLVENFDRDLVPGLLVKGHY